MKSQLSQDLVLNSELRPLTEGEKNTLVFIRNKKLFYIFSTYVAFIGVLIYAWFDAKARWMNEYDEDEQARFFLLAPYAFAIIYAGITAFFLNYYFKLVHPYVKDIRKNIKELVYFRPEKYQTPLFAEYYILTPANKKPTVKINKEIFDEIDPNSSATLSLGKYSRFIFEIEVDGKKIKFNETNEPVDI